MCGDLNKTVTNGSKRSHQESPDPQRGRSAEAATTLRNLKTVTIIPRVDLGTLGIIVKSNFDKDSTEHHLDIVLTGLSAGNGNLPALLRIANEQQ